jgi:hypothetical protein
MKGPSDTVAVFWDYGAFLFPMLLSGTPLNFVLKTTRELFRTISWLRFRYSQQHFLSRSPVWQHQGFQSIP